MDCPELVIDAYAQRINLHDFDALADLIAEDAVFWFSDGCHTGLAAIRRAFAHTWAVLGNDTYRITGLDWIARDDDSAACTYRFDWCGTTNGQPAWGAGRGTTILARRGRHWRIVHEHLSLAPPEFI